MKTSKTFTKSGKTAVRSRMRKPMRFGRNFNAWILMLPMIVILYLLVWRPTIMCGVWSFFKMDGYTATSFCGFDNYRKVLTNSQFLPTLWNTVKYVIWSLAIGFLPALIIAVMLDEAVHGKQAFRILIYLPAIIPGIAAMLIWYFIYFPDQTGLLNMLLMKLGLEPYGWLNDPRFSIVGIVIYMSWAGSPAAILLYFAVLQGVPAELYEAAIIDGAGIWKRIRYITLPSLEGLLLLNVVRQIIGVFQVLDQPLAMTGGGPNGASTSLSFQLYQYGFNSSGKGTGQAMALGVIIFLILIIFTCFYFKLNRKIEDRY